MDEHVIGFLFVLGSILAFGSFAVPLKGFKKIQELKVDPVVFQLYFSFSIFCSSWLVLSYVPFVFTPFGIAGASLWVPASILSIFAIRYLGMSVGVGIWAGTTILISFLWGAVVFSDHVKNIPLSIVALVLLLVGIAGLSLSNTNYVKRFEKKPTSPTKSVDETAHLINTTEIHEKAPEEINPFGKLIGIGCAVALGIMNGSMMVPLRFLPKDAAGINYISSFGIGVLAVTPVCAFFYFLIKREIPIFHFKAAFVPGVLTGLLWNIGNYCSIYATLYLGLTIGFPLTQVALVVSGLWGMFAFKELSGVWTITVWWISVVILLTGAALLSLFG